MVWSPPMVSSLGPAAIRALAPASTSVMADAMSNGLQAMSPASTTCWTANGSISRAGLYGRSRREAWRTWDGPNRAPGR